MTEQSPMASGEPADASRVWIPNIVGCMAGFLPPNDVTCTLRLVNIISSEALREHTTVSLKQAVPQRAFAAHWSAPDACRELTRAKRLRLLCLTAAAGDLANLEVAVEAAGLHFGNVEVGVELMSAAAAAGEVAACSWLLERGCPVSGYTRDHGEHRTALLAAAGANQRAACEWLLAHGESSLHVALVGAIKGRHGELAAWLLEQGAGVGDQAVMAAAEAGPPELFERLVDHFLSNRESEDYTHHMLVPQIAKSCDLVTLQHLWPRLSAALPPMEEWSKSLVFQAAAASPTPDWQAKVLWLVGQGFPKVHVGVKVGSCPDAAARFTWLRQALGYRPGVECLESAVQSGNADAVRFLLATGLVEGGYHCSEDTYDGAAGIDLEVLRLLRDGGKLLHPAPAFLQALLGADLEAAAFLLEACRAGAGHGGAQAWDLQEGGRLDARHFAFCAQSGSVRMMVWLREQGCPMGSEVWNTYFDVFMEDEDAYPPQVGAATGGCEAVLEWLAEAGCEMPTHGMPYVTAASNGDLRTLAVLRRLGVPLGPEDGSTLVLAMARGAPLPALTWLVEAGASVRWGRMHREASKLHGFGDHFNLSEQLAWIEEQRAAAGMVQEAEAEDEEEEGDANGVDYEWAEPGGGQEAVAPEGGAAGEVPSPGVPAP